ncbi:MAG: hypothetical protein OXD44_07775 [Gammaproteobacteria bacterium]|nr:hypothetical protein [Gammaproteobacteria bacterium]
MLAIDKKGSLYIFEIKLWESKSENLLQALRYGQKFGTYDYDRLDHLFKKFDRRKRSMAEAHRAVFDVQLEKNHFNREQVFVILTNGLDFKTREAIQYWRSSGLDFRPWVYRAYPDEVGSFLMEISRFAVEDNPYEDVSSKFFILNTNYNNDPTDHDDMIKHGKASAYFDPWKHKIDQLNKNDIVFLYQSGVGIVAMGNASGRVERARYHGNTDHEDEEHFMTLNKFRKIDPPLDAAKIKEATGTNHVFMRTLFSIDKKSGEAICKKLDDRQVS